MFSSQVENIYGTVNVVHQVYVHGSSLETMCVAVVVPEIESLRATMMGNGMNNLPDDDAELIKMKVQLYAIVVLSLRCSRASFLEMGQKGRLASLIAELRERVCIAPG
jgi:hypothetical protein